MSFPLSLNTLCTRESNSNHQQHINISTLRSKSSSNTTKIFFVSFLLRAFSNIYIFILFCPLLLYQCIRCSAQIRPSPATTSDEGEGGSPEISSPLMFVDAKSNCCLLWRLAGKDDNDLMVQE